MAACIDRASRSEYCARNPFSRDSGRFQNSSSLCRSVKFCRPGIPNLVSCDPSKRCCPDKAGASKIVPDDGKADDLWFKIREEAQSDLEEEPILSQYYHSSILDHNSLESALANHLAIKIGNSILRSNSLSEVFASIFGEDQEIRKAIRDDLKAVRERDPACISYVHCFLNFKGFLACQAHRVAHKLWSQGRRVLALLIQSRVSEVFAVDIHPGAEIGRGILLDHATGIVIGETAVVGDNVSIFHNVTLGGTGKVSGDRHPKICKGVLIGAGTKILGNVVIGEGAKIGAGSIVLKEVPPKATAVGNPARLAGGKKRAAM